MDFYAILDQVIALLKQRGRVSYRALKVQFHLDDEALEALKEELLYAYSVVDDQGRGLVWTDDVEGTMTRNTSSASQVDPSAFRRRKHHLSSLKRRQEPLMHPKLNAVSSR